MKKHELKTVNPYFQDIWDKKKLFEVRKNDRDFQVGDKLVLAEYDNWKNEFTGRRITTAIGYILDNHNYCKDGFVIVQLRMSDFNRWSVFDE